jgi:hypothetical protein
MGKSLSSAKLLKHKSGDAHRFGSKQPIIIIEFGQFHELASDMGVFMIPVLEHVVDHPLFSGWWAVFVETGFGAFPGPTVARILD